MPEDQKIKLKIVAGNAGLDSAQAKLDSLTKSRALEPGEGDLSGMVTLGLKGIFSGLGKQGGKESVETAENIADKFRDVGGIVETLRNLKRLTDINRPYSPFELPDKTGVFIGPPPRPESGLDKLIEELDGRYSTEYFPAPGIRVGYPANFNLLSPSSFFMPPGPESGGPPGSSPWLMEVNPLAEIRGWPSPNPPRRRKQASLGDVISILNSNSSLLGVLGDLMIMIYGSGKDNPLIDILDIILNKTGTFSGIGGLLGGLFGGGRPGSPLGGFRDNFLGEGGGFIGTKEQIEQTGQAYSGMIESMIAGNEEAAGSITELFEQLAGSGEEAAMLTGGAFENVGGQIFDLMGNYTTKLGTLSLLSSKAFMALRSMNPWAAAAAGVALMALGQAMRGLAASVGSAGGRSVSSAGTGGGAAAGQETTARQGPVPQIIIIDPGGRKLAGSNDLDRTLDRAGVDRSLRGRILELVRSGSLSFTTD